MKLKLGGKVTTANPNCTASEFAFQLIDSGASVIIVHPEYLNSAIKAAKEARIPESRIILLGKSEVRGFRHHRSLIGDREAEPVSYNLGLQSHFYAIALELLEDKRTRNIFIGVVPFFHIYGIVFVINLVPVLGASAVILSGFNLTTFYRCIQKYKVNFIYAVPPIILELVNFPSIESMSNVDTVFCGAAPLSKRMSDDFYNLYKISIKQGYGLAETSPIITTSEEKNIVSGSCGVLLPNLQVKILSEDG
ncbi:acetyl-CoA synthetase-like protein [Gigaspora margarita]|uniref:Acetyl-CoA synthetase-like protein n=1 Tax=Gigaspora margarita TaxID=4874 RepID=A0A8H4EHX3_GIGMA|nr:acetyl-CoA synthetase-like protein [Gigaspora margarita]